MHISYSLKKLFLILGLCTATAVLAVPKMVDRIAAIVNNDVILESSVNDMLETIKKNTDPSELPDDKTLRHQIIDRLVTDSLILQLNDKSKITVTDQNVTQAITHIAKQNNLTITELADQLAKTGINFNDYRKRIRKEMIIEEIRMNEVRRQILITPQEVDILANIIAKKQKNNMEVNISHILISVPDSPNSAQLKKAQNTADKIIKKLQHGEKFARLAATYSNDDLALSGGNLGWKKPNELPSLFEEKLITAHKNDIIGPLESAVGLHILKVNDVRRKDNKSITIAETNARHILLKPNLVFSNEDAKKKLSAIRQDILQDKITFNEAARKFSDDPETKNKGGELGWRMPNRYEDTFKMTLVKLKKGEISQPVQSSFGWHLIQLLDTRKEERTDLAQKDMAYRIIFNRKFNEKSQSWIQELRGKAYINIMDDK